MLNNLNLEASAEFFLTVPACLLLFLFSIDSFGQSGYPQLFDQSDQPKLTHFNKSDFHADTQFWNALEGGDGVMYFGNNDGVLIFNGTRWQKIVLPNRSSVRSLGRGANGKIYVGGYNELGIITKNEYGLYHYSSLKNQFSQDNSSVENIWQILRFKEHLIFRTFKQLFVLTKGNLIKIQATNSFTKAFKVNNTLLVQDSGEGLFKLNLRTTTLEKILKTADYNGQGINGVYNLSNGKFLITDEGNLYKWAQEGIQFEKNIFTDSTGDRVICSLKDKKNHLFIGTLSSGLISIDFDSTDAEANIEKLPSFQDKTVLGLYQTNAGNIWSLLDNGLDFLDYQTPQTQLFSKASVYDILIDHDLLYLATNQGVYRANLIDKLLSNYSFKKLNQLEGQAWSIAKYENSILISHDRGLFELTPNKEIKQIGNASGFWKVIPFKGRKSVYLACSYNGLFILKKNTNGTWSLDRKIKGFNESSRDILQVNATNTFWVCHGYKGVYRITLDESLKRAIAVAHFTDQSGLPSPYNVNVFQWNGHIVFTTNEGIYQFSNTQKKFTRFTTLNRIVDTTLNTRKLLNRRDTTWLVQDDQVGYFIGQSSNATIYQDLFLQLKGSFNRGMESIMPLSKNHVLFGTHNGLYLYVLNKTKTSAPLQTHLEKIYYFSNKDSARHYLSLKNGEGSKLPDKTKSITFEFSSPTMPQKGNLEFSYKLENVDKKWSDWQKRSQKEYDFLPSGHYTFKVKSKNALGDLSKPTTFSFTILPAWYESILAWIVYISVFIILTYAIYRGVNKRIAAENKKARIKEKKANRMMYLELEQLKLQRDRQKIQEDKKHLEQDIVQKSRELTKYTMLLVNKKNFFNILQDDLKELRKTIKSSPNRKKLNRLFQKIHKHKIDEEYLKVFDQNFQNIHPDFFKNLKKTADFSKRDLRLCAFIKMGFTNKEIAPLLNISVRGVETARYRVRKKMGLKQDQNFQHILERFSPEKR